MYLTLAGSLLRKIRGAIWSKFRHFVDFLGISGIIIAIFITHAISSDIWSKSFHSTLFRKESDEYANYLLWPMAHLVIKREKWNNSHYFKLLYCLLLSGCNVIAKQPTIYSIFRFLSFFIEEQRRIIPGLKFAIFTIFHN